MKLSKKELRKLERLVVENKRLYCGFEERKEIAAEVRTLEAEIEAWEAKAALFVEQGELVSKMEAVAEAAKALAESHYFATDFRYISNLRDALADLEDEKYETLLEDLLDVGSGTG